MKAPSGRLGLMISLLRGFLLLIVGVLALLFPAWALKFVVIIGGCLLLIDGILGALTSKDFGVEAPWPFWLTFSRNLLSMIAGLALLFSPLLATTLTPNVLANSIGVAALVVGIVELVVLLGFRKQGRASWHTYLGAAVYVALGLTLLFLPMSGALFILQIGAVLLAIFGVLQIVKAWSAVGKLEAGRT